MTELEQARQFLSGAQEMLAEARRYKYRITSYWECQVLAALSWVWDAQERESKGWLETANAQDLADAHYLDRNSHKAAMHETRVAVLVANEEFGRKWT
jgi:hypothetical protein